MNMRTQIIAIAKEGKSCAVTVDADPKLAPLWVRMPIPPAAPTIDQLADQEYPTPAEAVMIKAWHDGIAPCRARALDSLEAVDGRIAVTFSDHYNASDQILVDLVRHVKTWGQANQSIQAEQSSAKKQVLAVLSTINGELQQQNAAELEQRREAAARLAQDFAAIAQGAAAVAEAAEVAREARRASLPVVTTCNQIRNNTTCVSQ
jgi:septal ring factor EnvC (AmiA/AmiB activator)